MKSQPVTTTNGLDGFDKGGSMCDMRLHLGAQFDGFRNYTN